MLNIEAVDSNPGNSGKPGTAARRLYSARWRASNRILKPRQVACAVCGDPVTQDPGKGRPSTKCIPCRKRTGGKSLASAECASCGINFVGVAGVIHCSNKCRGNSMRKARPSCQNCGKPARLRRRFCSPQCTADFLWGDYIAPPRVTNDSCDRRRCKALGIPFVPIKRVAIFERDGWICGICQQPVDKSLKYPHREAASTDHIVPLSRGGLHIAENLQCAHLVCNVAKSNREIGARSG